MKQRNKIFLCKFASAKRDILIQNLNIRVMQSIDNFNFAGKKAFVRVDFNVPLDENFNITDDTRIRAALPTLKKILADGGSVIIGSHLGRPKGVTDKYSLKHILKHVSELLGVDVQFANDCIGEEAGAKAAALQPGEALLLENLRFYAEEEGKPRGLAEDATDEEKKARTDKGVLFTSGLIAGEGITGILLAGFAVAKLDVALKFSLPQVGSLIIFIALLGGLFALCMKAKPAKK